MPRTLTAPPQSLGPASAAHLHGLVQEVAADVISELRVDRHHGLAKRVEVGLVDRHALGFDGRAGLHGLLDDQLAPERLKLGRGLADRTLVGLVERLEFALAIKKIDG